MHRTRSRPMWRAAAAVVAATAGVVAAGLPASAAAPPSSFYDGPSPIPAGAHGTLVKSVPTTVSIAGAPAVSAWSIMYKSQDSKGVDDLVTGTVLVPTAAWNSGPFGILGPRPVVAYAPGTHGLAQPCAPSTQLGNGTDYEAANIAAALKKSWAVVVTDYAGYTNGGTPTYLAGRSEGHAVLDAVLAARQVPSVGLSPAAKTGVWGYSQGGQAAAWAGELASSYAPSANVAGVAAGGVPANFKTSARNLDGSTGAAFLLGGVIGLSTEYPAEIPFAAIANDAGKAAAADAKTKCVFEALFDYRNKKIADYTIGGLTLDQLMALPTVSSVLDAQNLGGSKIDAPVYQYHGRADEFLPLGQAIDLEKRYCAAGTNLRFDVYPSEHIATQFQAAPQVTSWLNDRFFGIPQLFNSCSQTAAPPTSTANPGGGDFVITLDKWKLGGSMFIKGGINSTVDLPSTSTFSANANVTAKTLTGGLAVPTFTENIKILGLPVDARITLVDNGTTGSIDVDDAGQLHIHGAAKATITIVNAGEFGINIPIGCRTSSPVSFPLNFDGPVSALGAGAVTFSGTTTFPSLTGCGLYGPVLSLLFSGGGNTYTFNVSPPAPFGY